MIIPAIMEIELEEIQRKIRLVETLAETIQIDIADGKLVDGTTFLDMALLSSIESQCPLEVHLMVINPTHFVEKSPKNINSIVSQVEAPGIADFVREAKARGLMVGLSVNNTTDWHAVVPYIMRIDFVQFMTIAAGGQGRPFDESVLSKISDFKAEYPWITIQADGGIDKENLAKVLKAGADNAVIGSEIFHASLGHFD